MEDVNKRRRLFLSLLTMSALPKKPNSLEIRVQLTKMRQSLKTRIHFKSDVFAALAIVDAKAPSC